MFINLLAHIGNVHYVLLSFKQLQLVLQGYHFHLFSSSTISRYVTLGYGEFYPVVFAAKGFVCLYMMVFLGMVSSALPEVITRTL